MGSSADLVCICIKYAFVCSHFGHVSAGQTKQSWTYCLFPGPCPAIYHRKLGRNEATDEGQAGSVSPYHQWCPRSPTLPAPQAHHPPPSGEGTGMKKPGEKLVLCDVVSCPDPVSVPLICDKLDLVSPARSNQPQHGLVSCPDNNSLGTRLSTDHFVL